ncbi:MAG TPA: nucleoside-diphosphate kinase [Candidatus Paceibacterota bacterium]|nr:nucleoside-diphosphate kinase [Candidatus Paceibacterota bacterium]HOK97263.1 nucleoside-diphosphate kinase [Candidatus Paceibacterota bacterium]HPC30833.1 nucleoside-diphosphate kinase [Candidatus Pacearchaeota archaeon]HPP64698.1 nucleoside-diphosphate kinase [Candidatus Paceibacterota bacterium]HRR95036.1 nucleoside-diphosphate kinase [Candidatus Paceibacterota bacterium]
MDSKKEKTLVLIKPDGVQRGLIGEVIKRYERSGLKLIGLKMVLATEDLIERHYSVDPDWKTKTGEKSLESYRMKGLEPPTENPIELGERVLNNLKKYLTSGPIIAMVFQGMNAVKIIRKITGATEPLTSDVGTIRGDFTIDSYEVADIDGRAVRNLIHASSSVWEAEKEIEIWFKNEELISYRLVGEAILYDVNLDGILE